MPTSPPGWPPHGIGRSSCKPDPLPAPAEICEVQGGIARRSLSFSVPPRCLAPQNSSHRTPNVENDPPQGLLQSNPPSLSPSGFRCAGAHFRTAREPSAEHASVRRVSRKLLGQRDAGSLPRRYPVSSRHALRLRERYSSSFSRAGLPPENNLVLSWSSADLKAFSM